MPLTADPYPPFGPPDDSDDIRRLLNQAAGLASGKRMRDTRFFRPPRPRLPPEVEAEWLAHIDEMEERLREARLVPLREIAEVPFAPAPADLPEDALEDELEALLDRFARREVYVDFPDEVEAREAYRFIVEELLDERVPDLRAPGTCLRIVYRRPA